MLKVTDTGVNITLSGGNASSGDGLFWFASALLIGAIGVIMAMSLLPVRVSLAALALLVLGSYFFNRKRQQQKQQSQSQINSGMIDVFEGGFVHSIASKQNKIILTAADHISVTDKSLIVLDDSHHQKYAISGFESEKEAQVMKAVLQGQKFGRRHANIKMQSSD